jgi:hypothetical protein
MGSRFVLVVGIAMSMSKTWQRMTLRVLLNE